MPERLQRRSDNLVVPQDIISRLKDSIQNDHFGFAIPRRVQTLEWKNDSVVIGEREYPLALEELFWGLQFAVTYAAIGDEIKTVGVYIPNNRQTVLQISMSDAIKLLSDSRMAYERQLADQLEIPLKSAQERLHREVWKIKDKIEKPLIWKPLFAFF